MRASAKAPRARAVLDLAAKEAGWGTPLPAGRGRGVSLLYSGWNTYMVQIAEVEVSKTGEIGVRQGGIVFRASATLWGQVTLRGWSSPTSPTIA